MTKSILKARGAPPPRARARRRRFAPLHSVASRGPRAFLTFIALVLLARPLAGQAPSRPQPLPFDDHTGFTQIFDGTTLKGWDGDPGFWRADAGAIVGQTTPENPLKENTFIIWRGGEPGDFELKLEYRISATNSGIQIRSRRLGPGSTDPQGRAVNGRWVMAGYQADIDFANTYTGQIYEERGRGFLAMRGQYTYIPSSGGAKIVGALQTSEDQLKGIIKATDWNQVHIIARGNMITEVLNGHVTSTLMDDDANGRALKGLIGFQMHVGEPMKVEFKDVWLKQY